MNVVHHSGSVPLDCVFRIPAQPGEGVFVENKKLNVQIRTSPTTKQNEASFKFVLKPGANVIISVRPL
ncbi:hypothetical protein ACFL6P_09835 [Candidatus Latescibacterota bacterium]